MRKILKIILIGGVIIVSGISVGYLVLTQRQNQKLKICPDEWIVDRMPGIVGEETEKFLKSSSSSNYFILDGVRREKNEFDLDWVEQNCELRPTAVY